MLTFDNRTSISIQKNTKNSVFKKRDLVNDPKFVTQANVETLT